MTDLLTTIDQNAHALVIARHIARVDPGVRCEFDVTEVTVSSTDEHPLVLEIKLTAIINREKYAATLRVHDRAFGSDRDPYGRDRGKVELIGFDRTRIPVTPDSPAFSRLEFFPTHVFAACVDSNGEAPDPSEPDFIDTTRRRAFWKDGVYVIQ